MMTLELYGWVNKVTSKVYFESEVQQEYLQEYLDINNTPKYGLSADEIERMNKRKNVIIRHVFTEVFAAFAEENAPAEAQLELV